MGIMRLRGSNEIKEDSLKTHYDNIIISSEVPETEKLHDFGHTVRC